MMNLRGIHPMLGGGRMIIGGLIMILVIVAIVMIIVHFVKKSKKSNMAYHDANPYAPSTPNAALDALKMKYAQGDITEEEYLKRKEILSRN